MKTSTLAATLQLEDKLLVREGCSVVDVGPQYQGRSSVAGVHERENIVRVY
jgi:hypothetical protein